MDMLPIQDLYVIMTTAIGATTATFSPALSQAMWLFPIKTAFTPGPNPPLTDADIATFDGHTPKAYAAAARVAVADPLTSQLVMNMPTPAGGNVFTTTGTTGLPMTVYGVVLSSDSLTISGNIFASATLDEPVTLTDVGQEIDCGTVRFVFSYPLHS